MKKLKVGDKVKYTSKTWGEDKYNPLWGGKYGKIAGILIEIEYENYYVNWNNGTRNSYRKNDLELVEEQEQLNLFGEQFK